MSSTFSFPSLSPLVDNFDNFRRSIEANRCQKNCPNLISFYRFRRKPFGFCGRRWQRRALNMINSLSTSCYPLTSSATSERRKVLRRVFSEAFTRFKHPKQSVRNKLPSRTLQAKFNYRQRSAQLLVLFPPLNGLKMLLKAGIFLSNADQVVCALAKKFF